MPDGLDTVLRAVPAFGLGALAVFFGRTLRAGEVPLIERIARVGTPDPSPRLRRYTRRLTAVWALWFAAVAAATAAGLLSAVGAGAVGWGGSAVLFVGEHVLRRGVLFRGESFPGLVQQVRDTWQVWRPRGRG